MEIEARINELIENAKNLINQNINIFEKECDYD